MTPLLLALIGAGQLRRLSRAEVALLAYSVFFVGVMFGLPLFRWLGLLPIFSFSGNFKHALPMVALSAALLAGRGLDSVISGRSSGFRIAALTASLALALLLPGMIPATQNPIQSYLNPASFALLLVMTATGVWLALSAWLRTPQSDKTGARTTVSPLPAATAIIATASVMFSLVLDGRQHPMRDPGYEARLMAGGAYEWLLRERPTGRVYISQDLAPANMNMVLGLPDLRVMDGVNDRRLVAAINRINDHTRSQGGEYWYRTVGYLQPKPEKLSHPLLRLFNIEFAMTAGPLPYNKDIRAVLDKAETLAPGPGYIGETTLPFNGGKAPGLLAHPPSLITLETEDLGKSRRHDQLPDSLHLRLLPALLPEAIENQKDGAWLIAATGSDLIYARHVLPRIQRADRELPALDLEYDCFDKEGYWKCYSIKLASLPCRSHEFDHVGWSDLRIGFQKPDHGSWQEMVRGPTWLYHDPEALPRAFFARKARPADEPTALELLASGEVDPRELALVSGVSELPTDKEPPVRRGPPGLLRAIEIGSQKLRLEVEMLGPGWLVVADLYYPGWRAEVNAKPERIYRTNFLLRGLPLTEGKHIVTMTYQPVPFRIGLWAMIAAIIAAAGAGVIRRRRQKNNDNQNRPLPNPPPNCK